MVVPSIPENSAKVEFEVVPMSSDGKAGSTVTYVVSEDNTIEGITLARVAGNEVTVSTDTKLENAHLIFVTYEDKNRMVDCEIVYVDLDAQGTDSFSPVELTSGNCTKVMLWYDTINCMPLADMIQY